MLHNFTFFRFHRISDTFLYRPYYDKQRDWKRINSSISTGGAIQAPFTLYFMYDSDWNNSHSFQLWNKAFSTDSDPGITNVATQKTIYDPSISGFALPTTAAFTGFTSTGGNTTNGGQFNVSGSFNKGWNFYSDGWKSGGTIFFEVLGFRDNYSGRGATGVVAFSQAEGLYWTSGAYSASLGRCLYSNSAGVHPQYVINYRASSYLVRSSKI